MKGSRSAVFTSGMLFLACAVSAACSGGSTTPRDEPGAFPDRAGKYLGQRPPGAQPELFASGIVSTGLYERDVATTRTEWSSTSPSCWATTTGQSSW